MSNTLKFGNGEWYGKEGTILAYNSENKNYKPLPFTFDRASSATLVNKDGLIETVGADQPRVDYLNNSNGALLLEPSRSNLVTYSEDFSNSSWLKANSTITNGFISPNGTNTAKKLIEGTNNGSHFVYTNIFLSGLKTFSVYLKKAERNFAFITDGENGNGMNVNLTNGTFSSINNPTNPKIQNVGNDWYRCSFGSNVSSVWQARIDTAISGSRDYQGDGTSGIYIWGAQLEEGSYATSYIPTSGSAVTRLADVCNGAGNEQVINSTEGVLYAEIAALADDGTFRNISLNNGTTAQSVRIYYRNTTNQITALIGSASGGSVTVNVANAYTFNKIAVAYQNDNAKLFVNGVLEATIPSITMPTGLNQLDFDISNSLPFYGKVKSVSVFTEALTDQELAALTT